MTFIPDLSQRSYVDPSPSLVAVGWLDAPHEFTTGDTPDGLVDRLGTLIRDAWNPFYFLGYHTCTLCPEEEPWSLNGKPLGCANLWLPGDKVIYVAPSLIIHYVHNHSYLPPREFLDAVERCPEMGSGEYFSAVASLVFRVVGPESSVLRGDLVICADRGAAGGMVPEEGAVKAGPRKADLLLWVGAWTVRQRWRARRDFRPLVPTWRRAYAQEHVKPFVLMSVAVPKTSRPYDERPPLPGVSRVGGSWGTYVTSKAPVSRR